MKVIEDAPGYGSGLWLAYIFQIKGSGYVVTGSDGTYYGVAQRRGLAEVDVSVVAGFRSGAWYTQGWMRHHKPPVGPEMIPLILAIAEVLPGVVLPDDAY